MLLSVPGLGNSGQTCHLLTGEIIELLGYLILPIEFCTSSIFLFLILKHNSLRVPGDS